MTDAQRLFAALYGASIPEGLAIHVRAVANKEKDASVNKSYTRLRWYTLSTLPDTWPTDANVWFGVGLRPHTSETAGEKKAVVWTALWADMDNTATLDDLRLPDGFPEPTAVVSSGHGLHLYWVLHERLTDAVEVKRYLKHIQATLHSDKAATDSERILRVPGTVNVKYADAPPCTLVTLHPERSYDLGAFGSPGVAGPITPVELHEDEIRPEPLAYEDAKWPPDREWLKAFTWSGFETMKADIIARDARIKSQSEFLWHIAMALHDGGQTKAQIKGYMLGLAKCLEPEDRAAPKRKIDSAIHGGVARAIKRDAQKKSGLAPNADGCLCVYDSKTGREIEVTNFDIVAHEVYDNYGEEGGYLVSIHSKRLDKQRVREKIDKKVITSLAKWREFGRLSFEIKEPRHFSTLQVYLNAQHPVSKEAVDMLGWYQGPSGSWDHLVTSVDVLGREGIVEDAPMRYGGFYKWPLLPHPSWREEASAALSRLLDLQEPHVAWALLGWTMSTIIAPRLREVRGGAEHGEWFGLWMWGMQGSGKTTATRPYLRLVGQPNNYRDLSGDDSTKVGLQRLLSSSNTSPVWIDDPRKKGLDESDLFSVMRGVLNAARVVLAADKRLETVQRFMRAPLIVSSEHAIENDQAMRERYLHVPWHKPWKEANPQTQLILRVLEKAPLERLARGFFQFFWDMPVEKAWDQMMLQTDFLRAGDRPQHAISQVLLGLDMAKAVNPDLKLGADYATIAEELWRRSTEDTGTKPEQQEVAVLKDIYDSAVTYAKSRGAERLNEGEDWRLDGDAVHISVARMKHLLEYHRSRIRSATVRQAVEQGPAYARFRIDIKFRGGKTAECITFNLAAAEAAGWGNPWPGLNMGGMMP